VFAWELELRPKVEEKLKACQVIHEDVDRAFLAFKWRLFKEAKNGTQVPDTNPPRYIKKIAIRLHSIKTIKALYSIDGFRIIVHDIDIKP